MKFRFDQSADYRLIGHLRDLGHAVSAVARNYPPGLADEDVLGILLLRIAARDSRSGLLALRFADLVRTRLLERRSIAELDKPPPTPTTTSGVQIQLTFAYA